MTIALICTILSAVCMAIMIVTDRIMIGDCYKGNTNQAWFVTSTLGSISGLILTGIVCLTAIYIGKIDNIETLLNTIKNIFIWRGIMMLIVGAIGVQIILHYFRCFKEDAHSAAIATWLASTPIFIFMAMFIMTLFVNTKTINSISIQPTLIIGVILATIGLVGFERITNSNVNGSIKNYRKELIIMLFLDVLYIIALKHLLSLSHGNPNSLTEILALMFFYWIGFAAGVRIIFSKKERELLASSWTSKIKYFIIPIIITEILGMLVFFFEYFGLTELDPTFVSMIIGAHIFLVYILSMGLGWLRKRLEVKKVSKFNFLNAQLTTSKLPKLHVDKKIITLEIVAMSLVIVGIALAYMGALS